MRKFARSIAIGALMAGVAAGGVVTPAAADEYRDRDRHESTSYWQYKFRADKCEKKFYDHGKKFVVLRDHDDDKDFKVLVLKGKYDRRVVEYPREYRKYYLKNYKNIKWSIACWDYEDHYDDDYGDDDEHDDEDKEKEPEKYALES